MRSMKEKSTDIYDAIINLFQQVVDSSHLIRYLYINSHTSSPRVQSAGATEFTDCFSAEG